MLNEINLPILVEIDEDNMFIVSCPLFKACHSYGTTIDEAMANIKEVIEMCLLEDDFKSDSINKYIGFREISINRKPSRTPEYA